MTIEGADQASAGIAASHPAGIEYVHARLRRFASASFRIANAGAAIRSSLRRLPAAGPPFSGDRISGEDHERACVFYAMSR